MSSNKKLFLGGVERPLDSSDVYKSYSFIGNSTAGQVINTGLDMVNNHGLVMIANSGGGTPYFFDTKRGAGLYVYEATQQTTDNNSLTSFNNNGFTLGNSSLVNQSNNEYSTWSFLCHEKFFDIVTYSGNGSNGRTIPHNLSVDAGMLLILCLNQNSVLQAFQHRSHKPYTNVAINAATGNAVATTFFDEAHDGNKYSITNSYWNDVAMAPNSQSTAKEFTVGTSTHTNEAGRTYVAYIWGHDTSAEGIIRAEGFSPSFSITPSHGAGKVTLGWQPSWSYVKQASVNSVTNYSPGDLGGITDDTNGWSATNSNSANYHSMSNSGIHEAGSMIPVHDGIHVLLHTNDTIDGGQESSFLTTSGDWYIGTFIKKPMPLAESRAKTCKIGKYTGNGSSHYLSMDDSTGFGIQPHTFFSWAMRKTDGSNASTKYCMLWSRNIMGIGIGAIQDHNYTLVTNSSQRSKRTNFYEVSSGVANVNTINYYRSPAGFPSPNRYYDRSRRITIEGSNDHYNQANTEYRYHIFGESRFFFDSVVYRGEGTGQQITHNLGAIPKMIWVKALHGNDTSWAVYHESKGNNFVVELDDPGTTLTGTVCWNQTDPTDSYFSVGNDNRTGQQYRYYVAYLFGERAGYTKLGSYTADESARTIDCGFTNGAKSIFILGNSGALWFTGINNTDTEFSNGNSDNDSYVSLASGGGGQETIASNLLNTSSSGFIINAGSTIINTNNTTYVFYAIAN